jgi:Protein of unknown function (DUF4230)
MRDASRVLLGAVLAVVLIGGGWFGWKTFHTRYVVETNDDGAAVAKVVSIAFHDAKTLKVRSATGMVQSTATDSRWGGMLNSSRVVKAPFSVDYFLDLSKFSAKDMRWDADARTLTIRVPEIRVGDVNIDESRATLVQTGGVFVTRSARVGPGAWSRPEGGREARLSAPGARDRAAAGGIADGRPAGGGAYRCKGRPRALSRRARPADPLRADGPQPLGERSFGPFALSPARLSEREPESPYP